MAINVVGILAAPSKDDNDRLGDIIVIHGDVRFVGKAERDLFLWLRVDNLHDDVITNFGDTAIDGSQRFSIPVDQVMRMTDNMNAYTYAIGELRNGKTYQPCITTDPVTGVNLLLNVVTSARGMVFDKNNGVFL